MVKIVPFTADSMEGFLISGSMVGLGLILAIYSIAMPRMKDIFKRRTKKLKALNEERDELFKKMDKDKKDTRLTTKYSEIQTNIEKTEKLPFHLDFGYILSATLFAISLLFPIMKILFPTNNYLSDLAEVSILAFGGGVITFLAVWYMLFIEFRNYAIEEFQKVREESQDKEEKEKNILSGKRKETLSDKVITLKRNSDGVLRGYDKFGKRKI